MREELGRALAVLFAAGRAVSPEELARGLGVTPERAEELLIEVQRRLEDGSLGVTLERVAGGARLVIHPRHAEAVRRALKPRPRRLTRAALEVLALVAYHQPITKPEIDAARGKDSSAAIEGLLERELIAAEGKRPARYRTTQRFLELFGLNDLSELPPLPESGVPELRD